MITPATSTIAKVFLLLILSASLLQAQDQEILTKLKVSVNGAVNGFTSTSAQICFTLTASNSREGVKSNDGSPPSFS